jgi:hypothetical protein
MVLTARQADVACPMTAVASLAGEPGPVGSFMSGAPHDALAIAATSAPLALTLPKRFTS